MSLASRTRDAVRKRPFLFEALRAGIVNYAAAARVLEIGDDADAVATALRRFAEQLPPRHTAAHDARVTMHTGLERLAEGDEPMLTVGDCGFVPGRGSFTAILAVGDVDATTLTHALGVLRTNEVDVAAAGVTNESMVVIVGRSDGPTALRTVEDALGAVPD